MPAIIVSISAGSSMSCDKCTTNWVNTMPRPVMVTTPTMMPAAAQASATDSVFLAPSIMAPITLSTVT